MKSYSYDTMTTVAIKYATKTDVFVVECTPVDVPWIDTWRHWAEDFVTTLINREEIEPYWEEIILICHDQDSSASTVTQKTFIFKNDVGLVKTIDTDIVEL